jgi:hypothetical protein
LATTLAASAQCRYNANWCRTNRNYLKNNKLQRQPSAIPTRRRRKEAKFDNLVPDVVQKDDGNGHTEYNGWYTKLFWKSTTDAGQPDALVADVHMDVPSIYGPGCVLHQEVGNVDLIMIAIDMATTV